MRIVSIGEILWDVFDGAEHLGGAVLNFAVHSSRLGHEVSFVSAVGNDARGRRALERAAALGLPTDNVATVNDAATGIVTVSVAPGGQPSYVIHRPAAYDFTTVSDDTLGRLASRRPDWITFGTLHQIDRRAREQTRRLLDGIPSARRFYDVNLRKDSYTPELVGDLLGLAGVVKLNDEEVHELGSMLSLPSADIEGFCREGSSRFGWEAACVTRGANGCSMLINGDFIESPGYRVKVADTVGSGDAFAAAFVHGLGAGWPAARIGDFANRVGALIASREGATPLWQLAEAFAIEPLNAGY